MKKLSKKPVTFYATDKVLAWYQSLAPGTGTIEINKRLEAAIDESHDDISARLTRVEEQIDKLAKLNNGRTRNIYPF